MVNIQPTFILKSGINILIGSLWLWWIYQLGKKENINKKCKDIEPMLRTFLKIIAWILLITCILAIIMISIKFTSMKDISLYTRSFLIVSIVLLAIVYIVQIKYINDIENSVSDNKNNCEDVSRTKKLFIIIISILIIVSGILSIIRHSTTKIDSKDLNKIIIKNAKRKSSKN